MDEALIDKAFDALLKKADCIAFGYKYRDSHCFLIAHSKDIHPGEICSCVLTKSANYDIHAIFIQDFELQDVWIEEQQWQKFVVGIILENAKDYDIAVNGKIFLKKEQQWSSF